MMGISTLGGAGLVVGTAAPASALPHCGLLHNIHNAVFGYSACHRGTIKYCWRTVYNADSGTYKEFRFACGVE